MTDSKGSGTVAGDGTATESFSIGSTALAVGAFLVLASVAWAVFGIGSAVIRWIADSEPDEPAAPPTPVAVAPPVIESIDSIAELAALRVTVSDVLKTEWKGHEHIFYVEGTGVLACDLTQAEVESNWNENERRLSIEVQLPPLQVTDVAINPKRSKTLILEDRTWLPWSYLSGFDAGPEQMSDLFEAVHKAGERVIASAVPKDSHRKQARQSVENAIRSLYNGHDVTIEWEEEVEDESSESVPVAPVGL